MAFASPGTGTLFGAAFTTYPLVHRGHPLVFRPRPRTRARIVALGAAPAPPPSDSDSDSNAKDVTNASASNPVEEQPVVSDAAPASNGAAPAPKPEPETELGGAEDLLSSPAFLKKKLEIVEKELAEAREATSTAEAQIKEEKASYMRLAADFDNYRRRTKEDTAKLETKSVAKVCKSVLEVLDNFDRAIASIQTSTEGEASIQKSYVAINKQLLDALMKLDVEPVEPLGLSFDPGYHDAIQKQESTEYAEGLVSAVFQKGYKIGDNLVRPAIVAVSTGPGPEVAEAAEAEVAAAEPAAEPEAKADGGSEGEKAEDTKQ